MCLQISTSARSITAAAWRCARTRTAVSSAPATATREPCRPTENPAWVRALLDKSLFNAPSFIPAPRIYVCASTRRDRTAVYRVRRDFPPRRNPPLPSSSPRECLLPNRRGCSRARRGRARPRETFYLARHDRSPRLAPRLFNVPALNELPGISKHFISRHSRVLESYQENPRGIARVRDRDVM